MGLTIFRHWPRGSHRRHAAGIAVLAGAALTAGPAHAGEDKPFGISGSYVADTVTVADGPARGTRFVDLLSVKAALDLDRAAGWQGASFHATVQAGTGAQPNALAGTIEGIDNAEVSLDRARLFEAYLEQQLPALRLTAKLGFVDLNSDYYSSDSARLLLAPPFGIGSELAVTGPNGPSIFPSTAPTISLRFAPGERGYLQFAAINAEAGVLGDPGGPPPLLREGALLVAEGGVTGRGKLALGAWTYTRRQDDLRDTDGSGAPLRRRARGAYVLAERPLGSGLTAFVRGGISDGETTPLAGACQAGFTLEKFLPARPHARLSVGVHQGFLSPKYRANRADVGDPQRPGEIGWEVTCEDRLTRWLTLQPDFQFIRTTERAPGSRDAVVLALRVTLIPPGAE